MECCVDSKDELIVISDEEEEFRSCLGDEEAWEDMEDEILCEECAGILDESLIRMFFKGVSMSEMEGLCSKVAGIGIVMAGPSGSPVLEVQKKLEFYVEESVAEHLALMDGLLEAMRNGFCRVCAFTDSDVVYDQITHKKMLEDQFLSALGERILEHVDELEHFDLKLVPSSKLERPLLLAQEAIGRTTTFDDEGKIKEAATLHEVTLNNIWTHSQQCRQVIEPMQACYQMNCWCGHELCYSCGSGCSLCNVNGDSGGENPDSYVEVPPEPEPWCCEGSNFITTAFNDRPRKEKEHLDLIRMFFSRDICPDDNDFCDPPPHCSDSYNDTICDLRQLPWLERFVSVVSDTYQESFT